MDYTTPDYTVIPNPKIYVPNDLPPSPRMKTVTIGKVEPGVWPEEYKHLDKGKPLIQELIDLEIKKHLGDDSWLDFSREAARRKYRFQPKKPGTIKHKPPERDEREVDLSVFIDVREEFGYDMREAIRFWSLHSMAHTRKKAEALTWYMKLQALLEGEELGKKNAALHRATTTKGKEKSKTRRGFFSRLRLGGLGDRDRCQPGGLEASINRHFGRSHITPTFYFWTLNGTWDPAKVHGFVNKRPRSLDRRRCGLGGR